MVDASATFNFVQEPNVYNPIPIPGISGTMTITDAALSAGIITKDDIIHFRITVSDIGTLEYPGNDFYVDPTWWWYELYLINGSKGTEIAGPWGINVLKRDSFIPPYLAAFSGTYYTGWWA